MKKRVWRQISALLTVALLAGVAPWNSASAQDTVYYDKNEDYDSIIRDEEDSQQVIFSYYFDLAHDSYTTNSITLGWDSQGNHTGFHVYRKSNYESEFTLIGTVQNLYGHLTFTDNGFVRGPQFSYRVVAYHLQEDGTEHEMTQYLQKTYRYPMAGTEITNYSKKNKKVTLKWQKVTGVTGYEVYRKNAGQKYKMIKRIDNSATNSFTATNVSKKKNTEFKVRAYVLYQGNYIYSDFSEEIVIVSSVDQKIINKFKKLKKKFPDGKYWNHKGKKKWNSTTITSKPCNHTRSISKSCNYYICPNKVIGYQCYGFAWKLSDLIYGKKAKIKNFRSYAKCKVGDVVRYSGHSVIIIEKHANYVKVAECNIGNTCVIRWGRRINKETLKHATFSRRY